MEKESSWYKSWFDSPYYHILYRHRDMEEARHFIDRLLGYIHPSGSSAVLDLACGRGRHSLYLNEKGFEVTGIDLSVNSIEYASSFENPSLSFYVHDMRRIFRTNYYDLVLNLFTSFGYFERDIDNYHVVESAAKALKKGGELEGITFHISRKLEDGFIVKSINFRDNGREYNFEEKVKALSLENFEGYFKRAGLELKNVFGDYNLAPYSVENSDRLILVAKKS